MTPIALDDVPTLHAQAEPVLERAMARCANLTAAQLLDRCAQDVAQLWRLNDFWAVSEVVDTPRGRAIHFLAAAGRYEPALVPAMERWARAQGCTAAYFSGRRGWARKLPDYALATITLTKEL